MKPIRVHITPSGPNPWKVIVVLEELSVPYELHSFIPEEVKSEPFISINPNGRVPTIQDPNTGLTLWESGAIIRYIIEQYDTTHQLSHDTMIEKNLEMQWLMFQMSGQGPYFGQASWFHHLHHEKLPSAIERYDKETIRILGVLDRSLKGRQWLVGNKLTYADLSFLPWNGIISFAVEKDPNSLFAGLDNYLAWQDRMANRSSWKKCMELRAKCLDEIGLLPSGLPKSGAKNFAEYVSQIDAEIEAKGAK